LHKCVLTVFAEERDIFGFACAFNIPPAAPKSAVVRKLCSRNREQDEVFWLCRPYFHRLPPHTKKMYCVKR